MGIDLSEGGQGFHDLAKHVGHDIRVTTYGEGYPENIAIECLMCNEVLVDFNRPPSITLTMDRYIHVLVEDEKKPEESYVIIAGNVIDGLRLFGPYDDDAEEANGATDHHIRHAPWVAAKVDKLEE